MFHVITSSVCLRQRLKLPSFSLSLSFSYFQNFIHEVQKCRHQIVRRGYSAEKSSAFNDDAIGSSLGGSF